LKKIINQYNFSFEELNFDEEKLITSFSDFSSFNRSLLIDTFHSLFPFIKNNCKPTSGFRFFNSNQITFQKNILTLDNIEFNVAPIIYRDIKDVTEIFIFACTIGNRIEQKVQSLFDEGDSISAFILDRVASELVELTADLLENKIFQNIPEGYNLTNRYSPGYCGWSVSEQKKLFSLLPDKFCGIQLTESSLMIPIKSVSGIYGAGYNLIRKDYHCEICDDEFCYKRKLKKD
jgi:hypothetical protein